MNRAVCSLQFQNASERRSAALFCHVIWCIVVWVYVPMFRGNFFIFRMKDGIQILLFTAGSNSSVETGCLEQLVGSLAFQMPLLSVFASLFCFLRLYLSHSKPKFLILPPPRGNFYFSRNPLIQWLTHKDYSSIAKWRTNVSRFISSYIINIWLYFKIYLFIHSFRNI